MDLEKIYQKVSEQNKDLLSKAGIVYNCKNSEKYKKRRYYKNYLECELSSDDIPICYIGGKLPLWGDLPIHRCTGLLITVDGIFFKTLKDSFFSSIFFLSGDSGFISKKDLKSIAIGRSDCCFGNDYMGHQLLINNKVVGLIRFSNGLLWDENSLFIAQSLFEEISHSAEQEQPVVVVQ